MNAMIVGRVQRREPTRLRAHFRFGSWSCENAPADALTADDDLGEVVALGRFAGFGAPGTDSSRVRRLCYVVSQSEDIDLK